MPWLASFMSLRMLYYDMQMQMQTFASVPHALAAVVPLSPEMYSLCLCAAWRMA